MSDAQKLRERRAFAPVRGRQLKLWMPGDEPGGDIPSGLRALKNRLIVWIPKQETRRGLAMIDFGVMDADCGYVMSSGIPGIERGDVAIVRYKGGLRHFGLPGVPNEAVLLGDNDSPVSWNLPALIRDGEILPTSDWILIRRDEPGPFDRFAPWSGTCVHTGRRVFWRQEDFDADCVLTIQEWSEPGLALCWRPSMTILEIP